MEKRALTKKENRHDKDVPIRMQMVIFLIGGAGDKRSYMGSGPNNNILDVRNRILAKYEEHVQQRRLHLEYLGYYEVFGEDRIWEVLSAQEMYYEIDNEIILKASEVVVIGHSLGGWNGAHFAEKIKNWRSNQKSKRVHKASTNGYDVKMLITLDPVGEGLTVEKFSDTYFKPAKVTIKNWINLKYDQIGYSFPDFVADLGGQWDIETGPRINEVVPVDHALTAPAMIAKLKKTQRSAFDELCDEIEKFINKF